MAITYDAPSNTITIIGVAPVSFIDIYNADQAGGWGMVSSICTNMFCIGAKIIIGTAGDEGHLEDTNVGVIFTATVITLANQTVIRVLNGSLTLGNLLSTTERRTSRGVYIYSAQADITYFVISADISVDAKVYLYDSLFGAGINIAFYKIIRPRLGGVRVWNCVLSGTSLRLGDPDNLDVFNIYISESKAGIVSFAAAFIEDFIIHDCRYAAVLGVSAQGKTFKSFKVVNSVTNAIFALSGLDTYCYMENWVVDSWDFLWQVGCQGKIYRQYSYNLTVLDRDGNAITTASVEGKYKTGTAFAEENVDANGQLASDKALIKGYYNLLNGDTMQRTETGYDYTYTDIIVKASGYETKIIRFDPEGVSTAEGNLVTLEQAQPVRLLDGDPILCLAPESPYHSKILHTRIP